MIIDTHAHMLPQSTLEALRSESNNFPSINLRVRRKIPTFFQSGKTDTTYNAKTANVFGKGAISSK